MITPSTTDYKLEDIKMEALIAGTVVLSAGFWFLAALVFLAALAYFLPWIIALLRGTKSNCGIFFVNLLLGWTMVGWFIAFIWALVAERKSNAQVIIIKEAK